ncbi:MAG: hypothetical protein IT534_05400 [Bauldia sp.]|nr:hypothetical protein [Bauldia sp.]
MRTVAAETIPDQKFSQRFYSRRIADLVALAALSESLERMLQNPEFDARW